MGEGDDDRLMEAIRRQVVSGGRGAAQRWLSVFGAPRRAVCSLFRQAGAPHGLRRDRRRQQKRRQKRRNR